MMASGRFSSTVLRLAVLVALTAGLCLLAVHQHDTHAADGHCAICHFATGLFLPAAIAALGSILLLRAYVCLSRTRVHPLRTYLAFPGGLRAPPLSS